MSRSAKVLGSVYGWWALLVAPGVLTLLGVFGEIGPESEMEGGIVVAWLVGYCASFAMIYVISAAVGHSRVWWWLVGSMLPWLVDWGTPYGWGIGLLLVALAGALAAVMATTSLRSIRLDEHGRQVTATVVKVLRTRFNTVVNNIYIRRRVLLEIPGADGATYQAVLPMLCEIGTSPSAGDHLRLRVDPGNPKHFALDPSYRSSD